VPVFSGFDLQLKQGDWWLYDWKDVYTSSIPNPSYPVYWWALPYITTTYTDIGTARITLGSPKTILGITFFQVVAQYTGDVPTSAYIDWQYLASFNNKIYGSKDDQVFLIFDAHNGAWVGGTFFDGITTVGSSDRTLSLDARSEVIGALPPGVYSVRDPESGLGSSGFSQEEYFTQDVGPSGFYYFHLSNDLMGSGSQSRQTQTFTLVGSSR
jgi:hypothetical protein